MKDNSTDKKELDLLLSEQELKVGDTKVVVHKVSLLDSIRLMTKLSSIASKILDNSDAVASAATKLSFVGANSKETNSVRLIGVTEIMSILGEDGVDIVKDIIDKTTNLSDNDIEKISAEDGIDLAISIYEANKGFFTKSMSKLQEKTAKSQKVGLAAKKQRKP